MDPERAGPSPSPVRFVAWGELLWDLFADGARLGGAPANAAYHAACLGAQAALVSGVGNDELGARALSQLAALGVDVGPVQTDSNAATGTVRVELLNGEPHYQISEGVAWDHIAWREELTPLFAQADVICFGTLAQRGPRGFEVLERALSHAKGSALRLCDLNLREPFATPDTVDRALALCNVAKLNEAEVSTLARWFEQSDVVSWLLNERGIRLVALTRGAHGAALATASERHQQPAHALTSTAGDAVGAGDAFSAALGLALARGRTISDCLTEANRYAAHVASHSGAMPAPPPWLGAKQRG